MSCRSLAAVLLLALHASAGPLAAAERAELAMGTTLRVMVEGDAQTPAVDRAVAEVHRLEAVLTTYRAESFVSRLNRRDPSLPTFREGYGTWYEIPRELHEILRECRRMHELSEGSFDPTVHAFIEAWGFETDAPRVPSKKRLSAALAGVGLKNVVIEDNPPRLRFLHPATKLNFGGVGKGFAMDRVAAILKEEGMASGVIEFGRSYLAWGTPFETALAHPGDPRKTLAVLVLRDGAVSVSSQGEQSFRRGGKSYGHILDPRTGRPAESGLLGVAVLAPTASVADALSTGLFVLGFEKALRVTESLAGVEAMFVMRAEVAEEAVEDSVGDVRFTSGFRHKEEAHGSAQ